MHIGFLNLRSPTDKSALAANSHCFPHLSLSYSYIHWLRVYCMIIIQYK